MRSTIIVSGGLLLASATGCVTYRERVHQAVLAADNDRLYDLKGVLRRKPTPENCLAFLEECATVAPLNYVCKSEAHYGTEECVGVFVPYGDLSVPIRSAFWELQRVALAEQGVNVADELAVNAELEAALARPWRVDERLALLRRFGAFYTTPQPGVLAWDYTDDRLRRNGALEFLDARASLGQRAIDATAEALRIGLDDRATRVALYNAAMHVQGNRTRLDEAFDAADLAERDRDLNALDTLRATGDVLAWVRSAIAHGLISEARGQIIPATRVLIDAGDPMAAVALAEAVGDLPLANAILDVAPPEPWPAIRKAARDLESSKPATTAVLRRALQGAGRDLRDHPATGAVATWLADTSKRGVASVDSCPGSLETATMVVRGISCGEDVEYEWSHVEGSTSVSTAQYLDGSGRYTGTTTTTTPSRDYLDEEEFLTVTGEFEFYFGTHRVRVPIASRRETPDARKARYSRPASRGPAPTSKFYADILGIANAEIVGARAALLDRTRRALDAVRGRPEGDEWAAELLLLSDRDEPAAIEHFRGRFGLETW
ncbi:MAG: hypothetical protein Q8P18_03330 [Pseudomonadota bacterium]|nr:hypothetical protein [Pseudomonadota bacterium]